MMSSQRSGTIMYWFRKAMRLHDNPSLLRACQLAHDLSATLLLAFALDPAFLECNPSTEHQGSGVKRTGQVPLTFLCESLVALDASIQALHSKQSLMIIEGDPISMFPLLWKEANVTHLLFEMEEVEPYGKARDLEISILARKQGIVVESVPSHTLFGLSTYVGNRPGTYNSFLGMFQAQGAVPLPEDAPSHLPDPYPTKLEAVSTDTVWKIVGLAASSPNQSDKGFYFPGGELEGLLRLETKVSNREQWVAKFQKPLTSPCFFDEPSTTGLSPYLTFGCVSVRRVWAELDGIERKCKTVPPPESLKGQLLFREYFYLQSFKVGAVFSRMDGNPICKQVPWRSWDERDPQADPAYTEYIRWKMGNTGNPFIDACMRQLRTTGWIHHLARHAVACYLTRGDLFIHWEHGRDAFAEFLVDGDWSLNNANWMWLSASCFFYQYFRVYSPEAFPKKYDPEGQFVRKYVPELSKFPAKFIYTPWKAPIQVQQQAGCVIGTDYPHPLVADHVEVSKENIQRMKAAYDADKAPKATRSPSRSTTKKQRLSRQPSSEDC